MLISIICFKIFNVFHSPPVTIAPVYPTVFKANTAKVVEKGALSTLFVDFIEIIWGANYIVSSP